MTDKKRRVPDWIQDILGAIQNIRSDIGSETEGEFFDDGKTIRAVTKGLSDIGEAARQITLISPSLEQTNPEAWKHLRDVGAMRNVLTHGYFRIDAGVVWATVQNDLPKLEALLRTVLLVNDGDGDGAGGGVAGGPPRRSQP